MLLRPHVLNPIDDKARTQPRDDFCPFVAFVVIPCLTMLWKSCIYAALAATAVTAASVPRSHVVHEEREVISSRWVKRDRVRPDALLPVRIGLAQSNLEQAHEYLMDVSHPRCADYIEPAQIVENVGADCNLQL